MILRTQNLRISHYLEDTLSPGRVGAIVCFRDRETVRVELGCMSVNDRINEWNFGDPSKVGDEGVIISVRSEVNKVLYFQRFRPDLRVNYCERKTR